MYSDGHPRKMWRELDKALGQRYRQGMSMIRTSTGDLSDSSSFADEFNAHFSSCFNYHSQAKVPGQGAVLYPVSSSFKFVEIDEEIVMH